MEMNRPTIMEIDLSSIRYNVRQFKNIAPNSELMAVIKANGYGHGAIEVAQEAIKEGATCFGVATVNEGIELRKKSFSEPILVLGGILAEEAIDCCNFGIDVSVSSMNFLKSLEKFKAEFKKPLSIHLKIDTGMHRIGILPHEIEQFISKYKKSKHLKLVGIFSHFPDAIGDHDLCIRQINKFNDCINMVEKALGEIGYKHMANSAATICLPESHFNLVRVGIGIYGYHDDESLQDILKLKPAMSLKTRITSVRRVSKGEKVGYGGTYTAKGESLIATIPIGYADGFRRSLSNKGYVLVKGQIAKIVGRVCMDQSMIDITNIVGANEGSEVTVIGAQGSREITIYDISKTAKTIPNDILTSISPRVNRVYTYK